MIKLYAFLTIVLIVQVLWWYAILVPAPTFCIPMPVKKILKGETPLREVYQKKELLNEIYLALGNETPIGIQFETMTRQFYPMHKKELNSAPAYYTLNDWALGMLEFIPFKDLPINVEGSWKKEVTLLMYQSSLKPIYGLENESYENNKILIEKWKILLKQYLN